MGGTKRNKLFILATDECGLNCAFCSYAESRKKNAILSADQRFPKIDLSKGHAYESIRSLMGSTPITVFSGGGEPLLNMRLLLEAMKMEPNSNYIITTGTGLKIKQLNERLNQIDEVCASTNSHCTIRVSLDRYHAEQVNYSEKLSYLIQCYLDKKWTNCNTLFFRTTFGDEQFALNTLRDVASDNDWDFSYINKSEVLNVVKVNNEEFKLIMRPTITPSKYGVSPRYTIWEYLDIMDKYKAGKEFAFGMPQGCRVCRACFSAENDNLCYNMDDMDITVTATGDVYLYGAELGVLGNIYEEHVTPELIKSRINTLPEYQMLMSHSIRDILIKLSTDGILREEILDINYPYAVIRNLMSTHKDQLLELLEKN